MRASDADGAAWSTPVAVDTGAYAGRFASLAVVNGHPAISYYDQFSSVLRYARATDAAILWTAVQP